MDRETDQHKWESQLAVSLDNYLMGNNSLYKYEYRVPRWDESDATGRKSLIPTSDLKNICFCKVKTDWIASKMGCKSVH